jgi:hypothetical protein
MVERSEAGPKDKTTPKNVVNRGVTLIPGSLLTLELCHARPDLESDTSAALGGSRQIRRHSKIGALSQCFCRATLSRLTAAEGRVGNGAGRTTQSSGSSHSGIHHPLQNLDSRTVSTIARPLQPNVEHRDSCLSRFGAPAQLRDRLGMVNAAVIKPAKEI